MNQLLCGVLLASVMVPMAFAAEPNDKIGGIKVGDKAPEFTLKDQTGQEHKLSELCKDGPVALVFYRSASWCPFCQKHLVQLQGGMKDLTEAGVKVVGISYDSEEVLKTFADKQKITFPLLSDPDSKTIAAYALTNVEMQGKKYGKVSLEGIPYPGTLLVDSKGVVQAKLFQEGYKDRHTVADLVAAAKKLK